MKLNGQDSDTIFRAGPRKFFTLGKLQYLRPRCMSHLITRENWNREKSGSCASWKLRPSAVVLNIFVPRPITASNDLHLKLEQSKCDIVIYIKYLHSTPPKVVHNPSGGCETQVEDY